MAERYKFLTLVVIFVIIYYMPVDSARLQGAILESLYLLQEYAREHVLTCLIPAFFIAGAIGVFISQQSVIKYLGAGANKVLAYGVASVSGTILAVCSCTVLPMFAGIYTRGAGLGPATAFLYSGPAINVLAIILSARVLGMSFGIARAVGAVVFSVVIGLLMAVIFRQSEQERQEGGLAMVAEEPAKTLGQQAAFFFNLVAILIFAAWAKPSMPVGFYQAVFNIKWYLTIAFLISLAILLKVWFNKQEITEWLEATWTFVKLIFPLLLGGVVVSGLLLGRPGSDAGIIPDHYVTTLVGGNSLGANFFAALSGALFYFATLTEVPIVQGLLGSGMGHGPALALLLAGPALSLPSMIVINSIMGFKRTAVFISSVVILSTLVGWVFGMVY
ncbi:MAG: permease [Desulfobacca sp.]|uniref:permease n=1 Tax=Desulfobacca sp. TaxID=2067990 RepID=UPI0040494014